MTVISSDEGVLSLVDGRNSDPIKLALSEITNIKDIKEISMDLFSPYRKAMKEIIPHAIITVDRFHVVRLLNRCLWSLNKWTYRKLDETLRKKYSSIRYLLSKDQNDLLKEEKRLLKSYFKINNTIQQVYLMVQDFRRILFGFKGEKRGAIEEKLIQWIFKTKGLMKTFVRTLGVWFDEIVNACIFSNSNARQEGINNKIKLVKRRGFGYRNCQNFKYRIMAECNP